MTGKSLKDLTVEQLEETVEQRRELVEQIFEFAKSLVFERGEITDRNISSDHTHTTRDLKQFEGFSFHVVTGISVFGGEEVEIWYHNSEQGDADPEMVFSVHSQTAYSVRVFTEGEWQSKFDYLMEHREEIIARVQEEKELEQERIQDEQKETSRLADLRKEAGKLKL